MQHAVQLHLQGLCPHWARKQNWHPPLARTSQMRGFGVFLTSLKHFLKSPASPATKKPCQVLSTRPERHLFCFVSVLSLLLHIPSLSVFGGISAPHRVGNNSTWKEDKCSHEYNKCLVSPSSHMMLAAFRQRPARWWTWQTHPVQHRGKHSIPKVPNIWMPHLDQAWYQWPKPSRQTCTSPSQIHRMRRRGGESSFSPSAPGRIRKSKIAFQAQGWWNRHKQCFVDGWMFWWRVWMTRHRQEWQLPLY